MQYILARIFELVCIYDLSFPAVNNDMKKKNLHEMVYLLDCSFCEHFFFNKLVVHSVTSQLEGKMTLSTKLFIL